ncbi:MAG: hypothetical protein MZV64_30210 [Ignavibacteriales bacterium]|nr:hypothetical protein [Ignavibacteriales bacterium]
MGEVIRLEATDGFPERLPLPHGRTSCSTSPRGSTAPTARGTSPRSASSTGSPATPPTRCRSASALHKGRTKEILQQHGVPTAPFVIARSRRRCPQRGAALPALRQAVLRGVGQGRHGAEPLPRTGRELVARTEDLLATYRQPVLDRDVPARAGVHRRRPRQRRRGTLLAHRRAALRHAARRAPRRSTATKRSGSGTRSTHPLDIFECPARIPESRWQGRSRPSPSPRYQALGLPGLVPHRRALRRRRPARWWSS